MRNPFTKNSVAKIVAAFTQTIDELEGHAADSTARAQYHADKVSFHLGEQAAHAGEAAAALNVASKIKALVQ